MKLMALVLDTFREIYARKVILGIIIIELLTLLITALVLGWTQSSYEQASRLRNERTHTDSTAVGSPRHTLSADDSALLGLDAADSSTLVDSAEMSTAPSATFTFPSDSARIDMDRAQQSAIVEMVRGQLGAYSIPLTIAVFVLGIFAVAGIIPSMMEKGTIDLLLSKPVPRSMLLLGRALGGLIAVAVNLILFVLGIWTLYGMFTGVWYLPFLLWTPTIIFFGFLVLYSFIILINVMTESWVLPMSLVYIHIFLFSAFLTNRQETLFKLIGSPVVRGVIDGLYYILPQTTDYVEATPGVIFAGSIPSAEPFIQGTIFIVAMLSLAIWRFERKDF